MILLPSPCILSALAASAALPLFVLLLSHGPWRVAGPMRRFLAAAALAAGTMLLLVLAAGPCGLAELVAAATLLGGSLLAGFTLWTLVAWGFTLTMLRVAEENGRLRSVDDWIRTYTGGAGVERFAADRCGLLVRAGFARAGEAGELTVTPRGRRAARLAAAGRRWFGLGRP